MPRIEPEKATSAHVGRERLAVNLYDLMRTPDVIRECVGIANLVDRSREAVIKVDAERLDETAVVFVCDLLTAASICDVLRHHDRQCKDHPTRVYVQRASAWERIAHGIDLTQAVGAGVRLNPSVFRTRFAPRPKDSSPVEI